MIDLKAVLERFLESDEFPASVLASTKAGFEGNDYRVELFPDGHWSIEWSRMIGNLYESPGIFLVIPTLSDDDYQAFVDMAGGSEQNDALLPFLLGSDALEEIVQSMLVALPDHSA